MCNELTLLIVAASPLDQDRLRLGVEVQGIRQSLQRSRNRERWTIESNEAVTVDDLRRAMLDFHPTIVHFAGHGDGSKGLCFEDAEGNTHSTDAVPLAKLFHHFKDRLKCVVLNACYSDPQGNVIRQEIDNVVGMCAAVDDDVAAKFAVAFYDAVFAGTDFRAAFDLGCTALDLNKLPDSDVPVFMTGSHLEPTKLSYSANIPEVERILYAYFNTPFSDRSVFTTTGESLLPTMKQHYGEQLRGNVDKVRVLAMDLIDNDQWRVAVEHIAGSDKQQVLLYVRIRNRNILVEWEATVGLWSMPVKTFLALGSKEPVIARVNVELADYYNHDFIDEKRRFQSVTLKTKAHKTLHGYIQRHTAVCDELMAILSDGNAHSITLEIVVATDRTDMPVIQRILSPTWLYSPTKDTG